MLILYKGFFWEIGPSGCQADNQTEDYVISCVYLLYLFFLSSMNFMKEATGMHA